MRFVSLRHELILAALLMSAFGAPVHGVPPRGNSSGSVKDLMDAVQEVASPVVARNQRGRLALQRRPTAIRELIRALSIRESRGDSARALRLLLSPWAMSRRRTEAGNFVRLFIVGRPVERAGVLPTSAAVRAPAWDSFEAALADFRANTNSKASWMLLLEVDTVGELLAEVADRTLTQRLFEVLAREQDPGVIDSLVRILE